MKPKRWIHVLAAAFLVVAAISTGIGSLAAEGPGAGGPAFMEPELQAVLQAEGQANLFVVFRERPDFRGAAQMPWKERGEHVNRVLNEAAQRAQREQRRHHVGDLLRLARRDRERS